MNEPDLRAVSPFEHQSLCRSVASLLLFSMKPASIFLVLALLAGCNPKRIIEGDSSFSVGAAKRAGILTAEYAVPENADLGRYRPLEVWVEKGTDLVVRLQGPHVDLEPRVRIQGFPAYSHPSIWSEPGGPPYEIWAAPNPLPETLVLEREGKTVTVKKRS
jgi:hypothetical protein